MRFLRRLLRQQDALATAERIMACWQFAVIDSESLWIRPTGSTLDAGELAEFVERVSASCREGRIAGCVFDLGGVDDLGPQWTVTLALLIKLARNLSVRCRVVGLRGRPAAAALLYRRNRELMDLVEFDARAA